MKKMMGNLQDKHWLQDVCMEMLACLLMLCAGIEIGSFVKISDKIPNRIG